VDADAAREGFDHVFHSISPEDRSLVTERLDRSIATLEPYDVEYRVPLADGSVRWIRSSATARRDHDGSVLLSGYWADVTREHELNDALSRATREANDATRAKSSFLAAMSHEIRTPMNGVLGLLELLSLTPLDAEQRSTLSVVRASGQSLLRIVDDILDFSKLEADRLQLNPAPASLRQLLEEIRQIYAGHASGKGLLLQADVDPRIANMHLLDRQRVGQILNNLVSNSLKFTERGGVRMQALWLGTQDGAERIALRVEDSGIGIDPEIIARLFQPFVQSGHDIAGRFGGTGLGLVISRRLAEMMEGTLAMESAPGRGTVVTFQCGFPVAEDAQDASELDSHARRVALEALVTGARAVPTPAQAQAEGTLVLVVDDHPTNRMVLKRQVNSLGYAAETAADGLQAFEAWKTGRYALVIADCNMPGMDGYALARTIRQHERALALTRTPLLACTANTMPAEIAACRQAGMDAHLAKPVGIQQLAAMLDAWLPLPRTDAADLPLVDAQVVRSVCQGDPAQEASLLSDYRRAHEDDAQALREALRTHDDATALLLLHRIRGAAAAMGSTAFAEACSCLEEALREGPPELVAAGLDAYEAELERLVAGLPRAGA
jgi:signal transduction histidine kinase/DNA-binding response OmpR family regulator